MFAELHNIWQIPVANFIGIYGIVNERVVSMISKFSDLLHKDRN